MAALSLMKSNLLAVAAAASSSFEVVVIMAGILGERDANGGAFFFFGVVVDVDVDVDVSNNFDLLVERGAGMEDFFLVADDDGAVGLRFTGVFLRVLVLVVVA